MSQKITIRIADRDYNMNAPTEADESNIRKAADDVNRMISGFLSKYPGRNMVDILVFVALNESISSIKLQNSLNAAKGEAQDLQSAIDNYIKDIEK